MPRTTGAAPLVVPPPRTNPPNDEELLTGFDEPEPARLADQLVAGPDGLEPLLEHSLLLLQAGDIGLAPVQDAARVFVRPQRLPVEERDQYQPAEGEQPGRAEHRERTSRRLSPVLQRQAQA